MIMADKATWLVRTRSSNNIRLTAWFSDNEALSENCDACIGYSMRDHVNNMSDGGEMDYDSRTANYDTIDDALPDILGMAIGREFVVSATRIK